MVGPVRKDPASPPPTHASSPVVRSTLDIAFWFIDRAESAGKSVSARKLQAVLYLTQAIYAKTNDGRKLMPATFLAAEVGPIEPTVYHIFQNGTPRIVAALPPPSIESFLADLWARLGPMTDEEVINLAAEDLHYRSAFSHEKLGEIRIAGPGRDEQPTIKRAPEPTVPATTLDGRKAEKWVPGRYKPEPR